MNADLNRRDALVCLGGASLALLLSGCSDRHRSGSRVPESSASWAEASSRPSIPHPRVSATQGIKAQASAASTTAGPPVEPLSIEKVLFNIGLQSNFGSRIRQDINLFALVVPELHLFGTGEKLDRAFLAPGISNKRLFDSLFAKISPYANKSDFVSANDVVKVPGVRAFFVDYWAAIYEQKSFVEFSSKPWSRGDWRRQAILRLNRSLYLDSFQTAILRPIAPVLMTRMRMAPDSDVIERTVGSLAFFRSAWATDSLTDDDLYQLVTVTSAESLNAVMRLVTGVAALVCKDLAASMDVSLPPDLTGLLKKPLDSLQKEAG